MRSVASIATGAALVLLGGTPVLAQETKPVDVAGAWEISMEMRQGGPAAQSKITFEQDGAKLTGTLEGRMGTTAIEDGSVKGKTVTFTVRIERADRVVVSTYTATVDGDTMSGSVSREGGMTTPFTAKKLKKE
ncbi:MAG: hypothetical protein OEO20_10590 [Gemmatimonadota bacterium]|nr:hypothetical protein [Gemmatimonadota bacterium]MDH3369482.1 hypothetical protein [Gemmatimonadota bacterium]MDH3478740.1 hypothetical protein [Gemmatimonadota bacterium]MDH5551609.1 hypothetical protein [Gemmatimonadota bacterium]